MKSTELAAAVEAIVKEAQGRITGIGAEQYAEGNSQKFERMTMENLLTYMEEELLDQINYSVMNLLRLRWLKDALSVIQHEAVNPASLEYLANRRQKVSEALYGRPKAQSEEAAV